MASRIIRSRDGGGLPSRSKSSGSSGSKGVGGIQRVVDGQRITVNRRGQVTIRDAKTGALISRSKIDVNQARLLVQQGSRADLKAIEQFQTKTDTTTTPVKQTTSKVEEVAIPIKKPVTTIRPEIAAEIERTSRASKISQTPQEIKKVTSPELKTIKLFGEEIKPLSRFTVLGFEVTQPIKSSEKLVKGVKAQLKKPITLPLFVSPNITSKVKESIIRPDKFIVSSGETAKTIAFSTPAFAVAIAKGTAKDVIENPLGFATETATLTKAPSIIKTGIQGVSKARFSLKLKNIDKAKVVASEFDPTLTTPIPRLAPREKPILPSSMPDVVGAKGQLTFPSIIRRETITLESGQKITRDIPSGSTVLKRLEETAKTQRVKESQTILTVGKKPDLIIGERGKGFVLVAKGGEVAAVKSPPKSPSKPLFVSTAVGLESVPIAIQEARKIGKGLKRFTTEFTILKPSVKPQPTFILPSLTLSAKPTLAKPTLILDRKVGAISRPDSDLLKKSKRDIALKPVIEPLPFSIVKPPITKSRSSGKVIREPISKPIQKPDVVPRIQPIVDTIPKIKTSSKVKSLFRVELLPSRLPRTSLDVVKPRLTSSKPSLSRGVVGKAFDVFVKRKGSYKLIGSGLTREGALSLGAKRVSTTLAASFKVRAGKGTPRATTPSNYFQSLKGQFRTFKKRKGKKIVLQDEFIEKRQFRLSTKSEVSQLKSFKGKSSFIRGKVGGGVL